MWSRRNESSRGESLGDQSCQVNAPRPSRPRRVSEQAPGVVSTPAQDQIDRAMQIYNDRATIPTFQYSGRANGLYNPRNNCYIISVLQLLYHMPCVRDIFLNTDFMTHLDTGALGTSGGVVAIAFHVPLSSTDAESIGSLQSDDTC